MTKIIDLSEKRREKQAKEPHYILISDKLIRNWDACMEYLRKRLTEAIRDYEKHS